MKRLDVPGDIVPGGGGPQREQTFYTFNHKYEIKGNPFDTNNQKIQLPLKSSNVSLVLR